MMMDSPMVSSPARPARPDICLRTHSKRCAKQTSSSRTQASQPVLHNVQQFLSNVRRAEYDSARRKVDTSSKCRRCSDDTNYAIDVRSLNRLALIIRKARVMKCNTLPASHNLTLNDKRKHDNQGGECYGSECLCGATYSSEPSAEARASLHEVSTFLTDH
jgi:hypothetical protein